MKYDAKNYSIEIFLPKFQKLLNDKYGNLKEHQRRNAFVKDYDDKFNTDTGKTIDNTVKQWFSYQQKPSIEKLMNICELLDCDIDYFLTSQSSFNKEIEKFSDISGLSYKASENIISMNKDKYYINKLNLQCLNLLLSDTENTDIINLLVHLIFTTDDDELNTIETTYNVNTSENEKYFVDRIAKSDFNYFLKYNDTYYLRAFDENEHLSYLGLELIKKLELLRQSQKILRKNYKGNIEIHLDYNTYTESDDDIVEIYENKYNKELANPNIQISFID